MIYQNLSKYRNPKNTRGRNIFIVQLWWILNSSIFKMSPQFLYCFRNVLLRIFGAKIGRNVMIRNSVKITYPWKLSVSDYTWIGDDCNIYNLDSIIIGSNVAIAHQVYLCTGSHDISKDSFDLILKPIIISDQVWIANDVFVAPGVNIGEGAVIGARSTVLTSIPERMVAYGYPAKAIRYRIETQGI